MVKKILIGVAVLVITVVAYFGYGILNPKSPSTSASYNENGLDIKVSYSQPSKRGRLIFGEEKDGALQPYGKYWRLGANAATEITFNKDVTFAGQTVGKGSYRMYAVPGSTSFKVKLNSETGVYIAAAEPDYSKDVLTVEIPVQDAPSETEKFTINFSSDSTVVHMDFVWDKIMVRVPITAL
jgi:hypothetical protein